MAEVNNSQWIGDFAVRVDGWDTPADRDKAYGTLRRYDSSLGRVGHAEMHAKPASFFVIDLYIITAVAASGTGDSCRVTAPWPLTIWAADLGCETAAGATGTVDLYTDDGTTDGSILDAAEDVKTAAGTGRRVAPEADKEDVAYGTEIYIKGASGSGGTLVGGQGHLYCQRL